MKRQKSGIYIAPGRRRPWEHELRVAEILANSGHYVEFLPEGLLPCADILLDGLEYEIKSPERFNANTLEHTIRKAIRQSARIIIDTSRMKRTHDDQVKRFLTSQVYRNSHIKDMLMITKRGEIVDIMALAC